MKTAVVLGLVASALAAPLPLDIEERQVSGTPSVSPTGGLPTGFP